MKQFRHTFCQQPKLKIYHNLGQSTLKCLYPTLFLVQKVNILLFFANVKMEHDKAKQQVAGCRHIPFKCHSFYRN